jgi:phosphoglycerate dehydrogenase-like enzyme
MRIAVLDDYQGVALTMADWSRIQAKHEIVVFREHIDDDEKLIAALKGFDVICMMRERTPIQKKHIDRLPDLKFIATTGHNNASLDVEAAKARGIKMSGTHSSGHATAELTIGLMLSLSRRLIEQCESVRKGGWQVGLGEDVKGKTLGVVGLGRLGAYVAGVGKALGMNVVAWSQNLTPEKAAAGGAKYLPKDELFKQADFITVHYKLSPRSKGIVGAADIARMKPTAFLINTSRGPLVDEKALIAALQGGRIGGAALDVYDIEPLPANHPYRNVPRLITTPHVGYVSRENYATFFGQTVENIEAWLAGKPVREITQ